MKKCKITLGYDGTDYYGWQIQKNGPTIQGELEKALWRMLKEDVKVIGSGRTDRGVHAVAQTAHFTTTTTIPPQKIILGVNSLLPRDISIQSIEEVPMNFHAIRSAKSKIYRYTIQHQFPVNPLLLRYSHWCSSKLNLQTMREGARYLVGTHDFSAFESANSPRKSSVRTISNLQIQSRDCQGSFLIDLVVSADGFLYNMVRSIAGSLLEVGKGQRPSHWIKTILEGKNRDLAGPTAPAKGLCLKQVNY